MRWNSGEMRSGKVRLMWGWDEGWGWDKRMMLRWGVGVGEVVTWNLDKITSPDIYLTPVSPYLTWISLPYITITLTSSFTALHLLSLISISLQRHSNLITSLHPFFNLSSTQPHHLTSTWSLYLINLPHKTLSNLIWISSSLHQLSSNLSLNLNTLCQPHFEITSTKPHLKLRTSHQPHPISTSLFNLTTSLLTSSES